MRKYLIFFAIYIFSLVFDSNVVHAESTFPAGNYDEVIEHDDKKRVTKGHIYYTEYTKTAEYLYRRYNVVSGGILYILRKDVSYDNKRIYDYYIYSSEDTLNIHSEDESGPFNSLTNEFDCQYKGVNDSTVNSGNILFTEFENDAGINEFKSCSIPIFNGDAENIDEIIKNYLENGNTDDALNAENVRPEPEFDKDVELPQNLKFVSGYDYNVLTRQNLLFPNKSIVLNWNQTVDTSLYNYEVEIAYKLDHVVDTNFFGKESCESFTTDYYKISDTKYGGLSDITYNFGVNEQAELLKNIHASNGWTGSKAYIRNIYLRVRNREGDKCSNYVFVSLDVADKSATATVTDDDGNHVADDQYDNYDAINGNEIDSENVSSLTDFKQVINFIKNGFGLVGDNGLVKLLSSFFGNIFPQSFWNIISVGFGVIILVGIINFSLKR